MVPALAPSHSVSLQPFEANAGLRTSRWILQRYPPRAGGRALYSSRLSIIFWMSLKMLRKATASGAVESERSSHQTWC